jgi:hypothetical protein
MRKSLNAALTRVDRLSDQVKPTAVDWAARARKMRDEELEKEITELATRAVGPLEPFETFEELGAAFKRVFGPAHQSAAFRPFWERARWLKEHGEHGSFRLGPRRCYQPWLSCCCGERISIYRTLIPESLWPRISEDT